LCADTLFLFFLVCDALARLGHRRIGPSQLLLLHVGGCLAALVDPALDLGLAVGGVFLHDLQLRDLGIDCRELAIAPQVDFLLVGVGVYQGRVLALLLSGLLVLLDLDPLILLFFREARGFLLGTFVGLARNTALVELLVRVVLVFRRYLVAAAYGL